MYLLKFVFLDDNCLFGKKKMAKVDKIQYTSKTEGMLSTIEQLFLSLS